MGFGDLYRFTGLQVLNNYLQTRARSIEGSVPSQADMAVFEAVSGLPPAEVFHPPRWYKHQVLQRGRGDKASLPGVKAALDEYGPADVEDTTGSGATDTKDDDDIDLFGGK